MPWHDVLVPAGAAELDEADAAAELRAARASLLPAELARYRALCREVAEVLTDAATAAPIRPTPSATWPHGSPPISSRGGSIRS